MALVQIIEFTTTRPDEVEALVREWRSKTSGRRTDRRPSHRTETARTPMADRGFSVLRGGDVQFGPPRDGVIAQSLAELCDGPMVFRNLDVRSIEEM